MAKQQAVRRPQLGLAGLALAALWAAGSASAHDIGVPGQDATHTHATKSIVLKSQTPQRATQFAPGLTISRDADTGVLRAPTDAEAAALAAPAPAVSTPLVEFVTATGSIAAAVPEEMHLYAVMSKRADGSLEEYCLPSKSAAETLVQRLARPAPAVPAKAASARTALRPAEGAPNE